MAFKREATSEPDSAELANTASPGPLEPAQPHKNQNAKPAAREAEPDGDGNLYLHTEPNYVYCSWEQFKNRFQNEDKTGSKIATMELLETSETLDEDIEAERLRRMDKEKREKYLTEYKRPTQPRHAATRTSVLNFERIRINSSIVNKYLARVSGNSSWPVRPHTFLIPFAFLIHHHDKMQTELEMLEAKFGPAVASAHDVREMDEAATVQPPREIKPFFKVNALEAAMVSKEAYLQMKCYVDFVREVLIPYYNMFNSANHSNPMKVRFDDLWSLFRYGELLCRPNSSSTARRYDRAAILDRLYFSGGLDDMRATPDGPSRGLSASAETHTIIRAKGITIPSHRWEVNVGDDAEANDYWRRLWKDAVLVEGFYLDYDGTKFAPVSTYVEIEFFRGEMDIHKLPVFPTRFLRNEESLLEQLRGRGQQFRDLVTKARGGRETFAYEGWSRTTTPLGKPISMTRQSVDLSWEATVTRAVMRSMGAGSAAEAQPEYISSDIIIDFHEAYQSIPAWRPDFDTSKTRVDTMPDVLFDSFTIMYWADQSREKSIKSVSELVVADDRVASVLWNKLVQTDPFSSSDPSDDRRAEKQTFRKDDLVLLPSRVMAYALRDRKFFNADVSSVKEIIWPPEDLNPFESSLKIDPKHKDMILSIVHEHFDKKRLAAQLEQLAVSSGVRGGGDGGEKLTLPDQDFIRGKGKGLVVLLHGAPGVGKTATAEAVALSRRRPLFLITCGDLGTTPEAVESGLKQIFRLANLWDCILLLDEADIFLSQREKGDESITRNAMVSIFLRTLEYYPGILFLTTNRPGVLDEAVKSRVHVSLHYPALSLKQTLELFDMNISRLEDIENARVKAQRASKGSAVGEREPTRRRMRIRKEEIMDFAEKHYNGDESLRWNGRQIRNAFQIAASLAHFEQQRRRDLEGGSGGAAARSSDEDADGRQNAPYIGKKHFKQVAQATAEFDKMRRELLRMSDSELAYNRVERVPDLQPDGQYHVGRHAPHHHNMGGGRDERGWGDARDRYTGRGGYQFRGAPPQGRSYDDDGYHGNGRGFDERYEPERYPGGGGYGRDGGRRGGPGREYKGGGGYAGAGSSVSPPRRRDRANRDERVRSISRSPSRTRSRSRARHYARDEHENQGQLTRTSGGRDSARRSGGKLDAGGDSNKYGRHQTEGRKSTGNEEDKESREESEGRRRY